MTHTIKRWVLKYPGETNYNFVALDDASGGYPYATGLATAKLWGSPREAKEYQRMFPDLELMEVTTTAESVL